MTYDEFLADYRAFIGTLPGTVNLPHGYFQNWRGWDYYQVLIHADFKPTDVVLDTGALHTFGCLYWAKLVREVQVIDNFYWARRPEIARYMSQHEWMGRIESLADNVLAYPLDLETLDPLITEYNQVLCISTIEHVFDDSRALEGMYKTLVPGGKLLLTTEYHPTRAKPYAEDDGSFYRVYNEMGLLELLRDYPVTDLIIDELREPFTTAFVCIQKG